MNVTAPMLTVVGKSMVVRCVCNCYASLERTSRGAAWGGVGPQQHELVAADVGNGFRVAERLP